MTPSSEYDLPRNPSAPEFEVTRVRLGDRILRMQTAAYAHIRKPVQHKNADADAASTIAHGHEAREHLTELVPEADIHVVSPLSCCKMPPSISSMALCPRAGGASVLSSLPPSMLLLPGLLLLKDARLASHTRTAPLQASRTRTAPLQTAQQTHTNNQHTSDRKSVV